MSIRYLKHDDIAGKERFVKEARATFSAFATHGVRMSTARLLEWLMLYVDCADDMRVKGADHHWVAGFLRGAGYKASAHVGKPKEAFKNPQVMAEYVIGQYMASVAKLGMVPPNPIRRFGQEALDGFAAQKFA